MIEQRAKNDCYFCCLAMAMEITYEELAARVGEDLVKRIQENGTYGDTLESLYERSGLVRDRDYTTRYLNLHDASLKFTKNMLWGRKALLQVRSKNYENGAHVVYWDGHALHDPSTLRKWTWEEVEFTYITIFSSVYFRTDISW